jgi:hypothetical protein
MAPDPIRRIENRRRIIASLRQVAETHEREAADCRARADRMEADTDRLANTETSPDPSGAAQRPEITDTQETAP